MEILLIPAGILLAGILTVTVLNRFTMRSGIAWLAALVTTLLVFFWSISLFWLPDRSFSIPILDFSYEFSIRHETVFPIILVTGLSAFVMMTVPSRIDARKQKFLWADMLVVTLTGLFAMCAGNLWTLLVAWLAFDSIVIALCLTDQNLPADSQRVFHAVVVRLLGIALVSAALALRADGQDARSESLAVLAGFLRLGIFPFQNAWLSQLEDLRLGIRVVMKGMGVLITLPLLAGIDMQFVGNGLFNILLVFAVISAAINSLTWLVPTRLPNGGDWEYPLNIAVSFIAVSAIRSQTEAMIAWAAAVVFIIIPFLFLSEDDHRLDLLIFLNGLLLVGQPGTPFAKAWNGLMMNPLNWTDVLFLFAHVFLLTGMGLRFTGVRIAAANREETWMHTLVPFGYLLTFTVMLLSFGLDRDFFRDEGVPWASVTALALSGFFMIRLKRVSASQDGNRGYLGWMLYFSDQMELLASRLAAQEWLAKPLRLIYSVLSSVLGTVTRVFEGYLGVLWEFLLLTSLLLSVMR